ncbi:class I SAM-dependent methyltransferase [Rudaea sp.]|uniref:class I SAM-dependent methyltransferase n=1 Tax=Rudaea sp. TaxID=2136325 RepID=UPI00321FE21A
MDPRSHWEKVYGTKRPDQVSWYRPHLELSLALIEEAAPNRDANIIDVGGGESTLVDDLIAGGYRHVSVLDLSSTALAVARARLGQDAERVEWLAGDVTTSPLPKGRYDVWHDRAVFHFLTRAADRVAYVKQVAHAVKRGGHVVVATFGPEGPTKCSGLDVVRYDADALHDEFGVNFHLVKSLSEQHRTPAGHFQQFTYCYCKVA